MRVAVLLVVLLLTSVASAQEVAEGPDSLSTGARIEDSSTSLAERVTQLELELAEVRASRDYFGHVLTAQTGIFSTIVVALIAVTWVFSYLRVRDQVSGRVAQVKAELDDEVSLLRDKLSNWTKSESGFLRSKLDAELKVAERNFHTLEAKLNRAFATMHKDQPSVAFIWWLRAAREYGASDLPLVSESLRDARIAMAGMRSSYLSVYIEEIRGILESLDRSKYGSELRLVEERIEEIYRSSED